MLQIKILARRRLQKTVVAQIFILLWMLCSGYALAQEEQKHTDANTPEATQGSALATQSIFRGFDNIYFDENTPSNNLVVVTLSSLLLPGTGQLFNGEYVKGAAHASVFALSYYSRNQYRVNHTRRKAVEQLNDRYIYISDARAKRDFYASYAVNTRLYSAFDAYRSASRQLERDESNVPISDESFATLALAPFTPKYVVEPFVFLPLFALGVYYTGRSTSHSDQDDVYQYQLDHISQDSALAYATGRFESVAVGEETFYRGILNTELIRRFGVYPGIFLSSVIFGYSHSGNGLSSDALTASAYGLYLGYLHHRFNYQLGYNVALHFWWNTIIYAGILSRSDTETKIVLPITRFNF